MMKVRLIKLGMSTVAQKQHRPAVQVPIIDTVRSWVREFQSTRGDRARLDFERISNRGKEK